MLTDELGNFLEHKNAQPNLEQIARKLYKIILASNNNLESAIKWKRLTFAVNGDFHHWICAIDITKKKTTLIFHFGGLLNDENQILIVGSSKFIRKMEFEDCKEIDGKIIQNFISQAIDKLPFFIENWKEISKKS